MIKILTVIGARPQIIKSSALNRAIKNKFSEQITEVILHTGQHYDVEMSEVFFKEMGIDEPDYNLDVRSGMHGKQTAAMIEGIENIALIEKPDCMIVYGDTNSTLAAAITASKLKIPIAHIEAGLRSFNKTMPEEINRIVCDHCSTLLFTPTLSGFNNLIREGFSPTPTPPKGGGKSPYTINNPGIFHCGDVMYDNTLYFSKLAKSTQQNIEGFLLVTIHRDSNTDVPERLNTILNAINKISLEENIPIIFPMHPRTKAVMEKQNLESFKQIKENKAFQFITPASYLEMIYLEKSCSMIFTDSGGVQKEAFFLHKPCIVLRPETEWTELVECGNSILCDADPVRITKAYYYHKEKKKMNYPSLYGDGNAAEFICNKLIRNFA